MSGELTGKVAIVTGGASGIGKGCVSRFIDAGAQVVIADVNTEAGESPYTVPSGLSMTSPRLTPMRKRIRRASGSGSLR